MRLFFYQTTYTGDDPAADPLAHSIYSAMSYDGTNFIDEGPRYTAEGVSDPDVFQVSTVAYVLFGSLGHTLIKAMAAASDSTYTAATDFAWPTGGQTSTFVVKNPDGTKEYRTFYCDTSGTIKWAKYDHATSTFGEGGTALDNATLNGLACDPSVIQLSDVLYLMYYNFRRTDAVLGSKGDAIYTAVSNDGKTFVPTGTLVRDKASTPGAVYLGGKIYVYFVDGSGEYNKYYSLAVAISDNNGSSYTVSEMCLGTEQIENAFDPAILAL